MRVRRSNGSTVYTYYYNGDLLRYLDIDTTPGDSNMGTKLYFVLDANGQPIEVSYKPEGSSTTTFYYYVHNLQGDVVALVNSSNGNTVVTYEYDAWGNILSIDGSMADTLGEQNPFRYRSYVYDTETGLYYLQSRYYDPEMGRFINADVFASTGQGLLGSNMFAYCGNNPVIFADFSGTSGTLVDGLRYILPLMPFIDGGLPFADIIALGGIIAITQDQISKKAEESENLVIADTTFRKSTVYYGVDIVGDRSTPRQWRIQTPPMDYVTAIIWVMSNALIGTYGKNANWGLYTTDQSDALDMAVMLGGVGATHHLNNVGEYPHYHVNGMLLFGYYKHFHVWYGQIYVEGNQ